MMLSPDPVLFDSEDGALLGNQDDAGGSGENRDIQNGRCRDQTLGPELFEEGIACLNCRKRKVKCSRQQPCAQCVQNNNSDCVYREKSKPGIKRGAVEGLNQRISKLENMFLGQGVLWQHVWRTLSVMQNQLPSSKEPDFHSSGINETSRNDGTLKGCVEEFAQSLLALSKPYSNNNSDNRVFTRDLDYATVGTKRRRTGFDTPSIQRNERLDATLDGGILPPKDLMEKLIAIYFAEIHPWIPVIHMGRFHARRAEAREKPQLNIIYHAIVSVTIGLSDDPRLADPNVRANYELQNRQKVILSSMVHFSVESLQALVITAFDIISSGQAPTAWSIVGSMARTAEQLHLGMEDEYEDKQNAANLSQHLIKRLEFLNPANSWIEIEERRRVFWVVFCMDRFASVATGWDAAFSSSMVRRRLPCHGPSWQDGVTPATPSPYFEASTLAKQPVPSSSELPTTARRESQNGPDIGGLAYRIEATDNLSLVTGFFIKDPVNFSVAQEEQMWMMKFKEIDLHLTRWKILLPPKWREPNVLNSDGSMDENLCLAHLLHYTAVILLHSAIAYPSYQWRDSRMHLSPRVSVETCLAAASNILKITESIFQFSSRILAPEISFCLFITGRMLIAHSLYSNIGLPKELDSTMDCLREISRRWCKFSDSNIASTSDIKRSNLADKFAYRLSQARELGPVAAMQEPSLNLHQSAYSEKGQDDDKTPASSSSLHSTTRSTGREPTQTTNEGITYPRESARNLFQISSIDDDVDCGFSLALPQLLSSFQRDWNDTPPLNTYRENDNIDTPSSLNHNRHFTSGALPYENHISVVTGPAFEDLNSHLVQQQDSDENLLYLRNNINTSL